MDFALPRLMLHQVAARRGSPEYTDIVDGQQRTVALREFRKDEFYLSAIVDRQHLRGKKYSTLNATDREAFDGYMLKMDRFEDASEQDIREVFRRINSYTVPLNPEEQRHAKFQGEFKWFIHRQIEVYTETFKNSGVLSEQRINRMADAKLLTEIVHAMTNGISTTDARSLRKVYSDFDREFELDREFTRRLSVAHDRVAGWGLLPKPLRKHYHAYSLILALLHAQEPLATIARVCGRRRTLKADAGVVQNLSTLAEVLESAEEDVPDAYMNFYRASAKGTNVKAAREERCRWFYKALTSESL